eukprot:4248916-Pleurochrysis_carterae.AAC.1
MLFAPLPACYAPPAQAVDFVRARLNSMSLEGVCEAVLDECLSKDPHASAGARSRARESERGE